MNIMSMLSTKGMNRLRRDFEEKEEGLDLAEFVSAMLSRLPDQGISKVNLVAQLIDLFEQVDVNGDGSMEWEEFSGFCIEAGMAASRRETMTCSHYVPREYVDVTSSSAPITWMKYFDNINKLMVCQSETKVMVYDPNHNQNEMTLLHTIGATQALGNQEDPSQASVILCAELIDIDNRNIIVTSMSNMTLCFWDAMSYDIVESRPPRFITSFFCREAQQKLAWGSGCDLLFSCTCGADIKVWRAETLPEFSIKLVQKLCRHTDIIQSLLFIPEHQVLVSASLDTKLILWVPDEISEGSKTYNMILRGDRCGHGKGVRHVTYAGGGVVLSAAFDLNILAWDVSGLSKSPLFQLTGHIQPLVGVEMLSSKFAVSVDIVGTIKIWDVSKEGDVLTSERCLQTMSMENYRSGPSVAAVSNSSRPPSFKPNHIAVSRPSSGYSSVIVSTSKMHIWDPSSENSQDVIPVGALYNSTSMTIIGAMSKSIRVWNVRNGSLVSYFQDVTKSDITAMCLDFRKRKFILADQSGVITVYNYLNGALMKTSADAPHTGEVSAMDYSVEDKVIVTAGWDRTVRLYDEVESERVELLRIISKAHDSDIVWLQVSHQLSLVATGADDGTLRLWDFQFCGLQGDFKVNGEVTAMKFVGDLPLLVVADRSCGVSFWAVRPWWNQSGLPDNCCIHQFTNQSFLDLKGKKLFDDTGALVNLEEHQQRNQTVSCMVIIEVPIEAEVKEHRGSTGTEVSPDEMKESSSHDSNQHEISTEDSNVDRNDATRCESNLGKGENTEKEATNCGNSNTNNASTTQDNNSICEVENSIRKTTTPIQSHMSDTSTSESKHDTLTSEEQAVEEVTTQKLPSNPTGNKEEQDSNSTDNTVESKPCEEESNADKCSEGDSCSDESESATKSVPPQTKYLLVCGDDAGNISCYDFTLLPWVLGMSRPSEEHLPRQKPNYNPRRKLQRVFDQEENRKKTHHVSEFTEEYGTDEIVVEDRRVKRIDLVQPVHCWSAHQSSICSLQYSEEPRMLLSCSRDKTIRAWAPDTANLLGVMNCDETKESSMSSGVSSLQPWNVHVDMEKRYASELETAGALITTMTENEQQQLASIVDTSRSSMRQRSTATHQRKQSSDGYKISSNHRRRSSLRRRASRTDSLRIPVDESEDRFRLIRQFMGHATWVKSQVELAHDAVVAKQARQQRSKERMAKLKAKRGQSKKMKNGRRRRRRRGKSKVKKNKPGVHETTNAGGQTNQEGISTDEKKSRRSTVNSEIELDSGHLETVPIKDPGISVSLPKLKDVETVPVLAMDPHDKDNWGINSMNRQRLMYKHLFSECVAENDRSRQTESFRAMSEPSEFLQNELLLKEGKSDKGKLGKLEACSPEEENVWGTIQENLDGTMKSVIKRAKKEKKDKIKQSKAFKRGSSHRPIGTSDRPHRNNGNTIIDRAIEFGDRMGVQPVGHNFLGRGTINSVVRGSRSNPRDSRSSLGPLGRLAEQSFRKGKGLLSQTLDGIATKQKFQLETSEEETAKLQKARERLEKRKLKMMHRLREKRKQLQLERIERHSVLAFGETRASMAKAKVAQAPSRDQLERVKRAKQFGPYSRKDVAHVRDMFLALDIDNNGTIDLSEFKANFQHTSQGGGNFRALLDQAPSMFNALDEDGSGFIDVEEIARVVFKDATTQEFSDIRAFLRMPEDRTRRTSKFTGILSHLKGKQRAPTVVIPTMTQEKSDMLKEMGELFTLFDKDSDGGVTVEELYNAIEQNKTLYAGGYEGITREDLESIFKDIDDNGDNVVDFDEFVQVFSSIT